MKIDRPLLMGILNVTPDSFSDGGSYDKPVDAVQAGLQMFKEGADIVDVGGESTRPDAKPVHADVEIQRVFKVVHALARASESRVSVDTSKAAVANELRLKWMINDVTAFGDPQMARVCAEAKCQVCLMHMQGTPQTMQQNPNYKDVVREVRDYLLERASYAQSEGVDRDNIWIDPGFGFGKTVEHNLELLRNLTAFIDTGYKVLIGVSRKSFLGRLGCRDGGILPVEDRLPATLAAQVIAQKAGVACIRTHDVKESRIALDLAAVL